MDILLYGAAGFIWGLAVSIFNNFWGTKALKGDSKGTAMIIFPLRILIYGLAMYLVKFNTAMLIGTVLGLLEFLPDTFHAMLRQRQTRSL